MAVTQETILLYIILGALAGIIFSLRRIYILENRIRDLEKTIVRSLPKKRKR